MICPGSIILCSQTNGTNDNKFSKNVPLVNELEVMKMFTYAEHARHKVMTKSQHGQLDT